MTIENETLWEKTKLHLESYQQPPLHYSRKVCLTLILCILYDFPPVQPNFNQNLNMTFFVSHKTFFFFLHQWRFQIWNIKPELCIFHWRKQFPGICEGNELCHNPATKIFAWSKENRKLSSTGGRERLVYNQTMGINPKLQIWNRNGIFGQISCHASAELNSSSTQMRFLNWKNIILDFIMRRLSAYFCNIYMMKSKRPIIKWQFWSLGWYLLSCSKIHSV